MEKFDISLLYVEDEKILRNVYKKILEARVSKLIVASDGEEGFELYKEHQPDLVLTDIKMPVMNGLEMTKKIKKHHRDSRIIIMSAYGQPQYFMQAIENGVKGFLLKPVENERLFDVISEQSKEILLEKQLHEQEKKRKIAEEALKRSESILKAVSYAAEKFLQVSYGEKSITQVLEMLGKATNVSRVYIFENHNKEQKIFARMLYEWTAEEVKPEIDDENVKDVAYEDVGMERWMEVLGQGKAIYGRIRDLPEKERPLLEFQDIQSIVIMPIFTDEYWYGMIGFDDCYTERNWTNAELRALSAAADITGAAIHRKKVEEELRKLNTELEQRVEERTTDLKKEINERKTAELMLRESEEKYRQIFENANDGIMLIAGGIIEFINPKIYEITGFLPKECISQPFTGFIHPDHVEMVEDVYNRQLRREKVPNSLDIKIVAKAGNIRWIEMKSTLIKWENEQAVLAFLADITERKNTAEELYLLNQRLEQRVQEELKKIEKQQQLLIQKSKLESLGELAAGIAHEINQPLGGISMGLDNILYKVEDGKADARYIQSKFKTIFEDIERIRNIINHVRIFSKDQDVVDFDKVDVKEVVKNALSMIQKQYTNHNISFSMHLDKNCFTFGNKYKLEQVVLNLLSNAKYAVDEKENQNHHPDYQKKINIKVHGADDKVFASVEDNGTGISSEDQIFIFDPFFTTKKADLGTGLGLSISYGIVKEMKGDISVQSQSGEFTKMTISLPKYDKNN